MRDLSDLDADAQIADEPLERLRFVELEQLQVCFEVERLLDALDAVYCHENCSFSNIMQNQGGRLVLIHLAFAGSFGSAIPEGFPKHLLNFVSGKSVDGAN